jgi:A nuclease family of the HNH/ENDO VII superfamily with conserved AHH
MCCGKKTICLLVEKHHLIPKRKFRKHPLILSAGVDIRSDMNNLMDMAGHRGNHYQPYYDSVQALLDAGYIESQLGRVSPMDAYKNVCRTLREGISDQTIRLYENTSVYPVP